MKTTIPRQRPRRSGLSLYGLQGKLLHISLWGTYSGEVPEVFILTDAQGNEVHRAAEVGDHVKIHLPGPRSFKSDGADWVRVERIDEEKNKRLDEVLTAVRLRPCANPCMKDAEIAHFFDDLKYQYRD